MERSNEESLDIVFVQPFDYIRLADRHNYIPLATRKEKLATIFVVKADSPLNTLQDLTDKTIAMPPIVAAVSRLGHKFLIENELIAGINVRMTYHSSHVTCLQQVLLGTSDACATAFPLMRFMEQKERVKFKIVAQTVDIPHTLFIVHSRVPKKQRQQILATILSWSTTEQGQQMLVRGNMKPFVSVKDKEYNIVRKMIGARQKP